MQEEFSLHVLVLDTRKNKTYLLIYVYIIVWGTWTFVFSVLLLFAVRCTYVGRTSKRKRTYYGSSNFWTARMQHATTL